MLGEFISYILGRFMTREEGADRGISPAQRVCAGDRFLFRELLDLAAFEARCVRDELFAHQLHQEVETEDVHNRHGKDRGIREVDDGTKAGCRTDYNEDAKDNLERQFG